MALGVALPTHRYDFLNMEAPLSAAICLTVWYTGIGPAILTVVRSSLAFDYFFAEPCYTHSFRR
jgi:K+-sensing histidine kinase KdpD